MARGSAEQLATVLWRAAGETDLAHLGDAVLLDRYLSCADERAFRALVGRHAPLVWEVCARSLRSHQDAEDAFQATFIALARRARAGARIAVLPAWLREVAWRAARDVRLSATRRREVFVESMSEAPAREPADPRELAEVLEEEVGRLPEELRRPFELCRFQEQTYAEAAGVLGCSVATVCRRVEQAADALRSRLSRRGLMPLGGTAGVVLASTTAVQAVPPGLAARAADLALAVSDGRATPTVLMATADAALRTGGLGHFKLAGLALLAVACGVGGLAFFTSDKPAANADSPPAAERDKPRTGNLPPGALARIVTDRVPAGEKPGPEEKPATTRGVMSLAFSPDGRTLATVSLPVARSAFRLWDASNGAFLTTPKLTGDARALTTQSSRSGFTALCVSDSGPPRWAGWDANRGTTMLPPIPNGVLTSALAPDGRTAAFASAERIVIADAVTGIDRERLVDAPASVDWLAFSPDSKTLIAHSKEQGGEFVVWTLAEGRWQRPLLPAGRTGFRTGRILAVSPDARFVAVPCDNGFADPILVHDLSRNGSVAGWFEVGGGPFTLTFSPDSRSVALTNEAANVRVWEVSSGRLRRDFAGHGGKILTVAFSPDGRRLASGSADCTALIWDMGTPARPVPTTDGERLATLAGLDAAAGYDAVLALAAQPDDAVRLLRPHLISPPVNEVDTIGWVRALAEPDTAEFRAAAEALEKHGRSVEGVIRKELAFDPPESTRIELLRLVERLDGPRSPRRLTEVRGLEALEKAGSTAARKLLADVAARYPDSLASRDATAALSRLAFRGLPPNK